MIKQEKPLSIDRRSLVGTGRELVLHERNRKKRETQSDGFTRNQQQSSMTKTHCTARRNLSEYFDKDFTFSPKLNEQSIKLAKERTARLITNDDDNSNKEFSRSNELQKLYTFKPAVSPASIRIVQSLGTTFLTRQQLHIERKQKLLEESQRIPIPLLHRPKKNSKLISSSENSPENPYKSFATESIGEENERLHLPPCPSTPTLTQQSSVEEISPQPSLLQSSVVVSNTGNVEKNRIAKASSSLVFSPVLQSHSSHRSLTRSITQSTVKLQSERKRSPIRRLKYTASDSDQEIFRFKRLKVKAETVMRVRNV